MGFERRRSVVLAEGLWRVTPHTVTEIDELERELERGARVRLFSEECQFRDEVSCLAVLVRHKSASAWDALGMSINASRFRQLRRGLATELRLAADDLSTAVS
jgi:DNA-binding IclR family transcriptional regulator